MSAQLVLSLSVTPNQFQWCWCDAQGNTAKAEIGDHTELQSAITRQGKSSIETWLILPGEKCVTRELEYNEKEKKHLRNLLPFQLEESLIGDVDDIHLAIASPRDGKISIAYADKYWVKEQIDNVKNLGLDIIRCSVLPLVWAQNPQANEWIIAAYQQQLHVYYDSDLGFSVPLFQSARALTLLVAERKPESIILRAADAAGMAELENLLPEALQQIPRKTEIKNWNQNLSTTSLDLCQGEFSRRLPVERWWKLWKNLATFAGICLLIALVVLMIQIHQLNKENLQIRAATEKAARLAIPQGKLTNPEKQVAGLLSQLQPTHQSAGLMELLSTSLPVVTQSADVKIKALNFSEETGELAISLQAKDFSAFDKITSQLKERGLVAEILNVNAQGESQTARLRIHK